jgi:hypothetical protein
MTEKRKVTRLILHEDEPASLTSSQRGANLDLVGFNFGLLLQYRPVLAVEVLELYDRARRVRKDDPAAPEEDILSATEEWIRLGKAAYDDQS